jgi:hypothetical protein
MKTKGGYKMRRIRRKLSVPLLSGSAACRYIDVVKYTYNVLLLLQCRTYTELKEMPTDTS